ncbi:MAG: SDR family NAD(P)-dependent oxidoreductase [Alphaproteobacteria bacterium]|nr:SDR family NAD(P)-dependent oxidoreductase [Alphaproteobacteria bacterium]
MALEGQHVVVTGAAQGIGECTARTLAAKGCRLYLTDIQAERVAGVANELGARHGPVDIGDPPSAQTMINHAISQLGHIDSLVNIAGIDGPDDDALEETEEHWREIIDVDLSGPWWITRAALPHMIERGGGRVVITSSVTGVMGFAEFSPSYHAAKAGLVGLTLGLSARFETDGILINAITPGYIGTTGNPMPQSEIDAYNAVNPLGMGGAQPVADAVCYLLDDSGRWISGTVMNVTGGLLRG